MPHLYNRRCYGHDYRSRCFYMITMVKAASAPTLSEIRVGYGNTFRVLTPLGRKIEERIKNFRLLHPHLFKVCDIVMPDHIHILLYVKERIPEDLEVYINRFIDLCSDDWATIRGDRGKLPLFDNGFNDRIVMREGYKDILKNYILDNPQILDQENQSRYFPKENNSQDQRKRMCGFR